jgi:hypothetical protein
LAINEKLGTAQVDISAPLDKLAAQINQAREMVAGGLGKAEAAAASFRAGLGALGAAFAVERIVSWSGAILESGARLVDQAGSLGLSTTQLQVYTFAAAQAGLGQEELNQSMAFFARNVGMIAQGQVTPASKAFSQLGIAIYDVNGNLRSTGDIYTEFMTKLGRVKDATMANALATEAMGRAGGRTLALARDLANEGFGAIEERAREMGVVIGEDTLRAMKKLDDQIAVLSMSVKSQLAVAFADSIPAITGVTNAINDALKVLHIWRTGDVAALQSLRAAIEATNSQIEQLGRINVLGIFDAQIAAKKKHLDNLIAEYNRKSLAPPPTGAAPSGKPVSSPEEIEAQKKAAEEQKKLQEQFDKTVASIELETAAYARLAGALGKGIEAEREAQTLNDIAAAQAQFQGKLTDELIRQIEREVRARNAVKFASEDHKEALDKMTQAQQKEIEAVEKAIDAYAEVSKEQRDLDDNLKLIDAALRDNELSFEKYNQARAGAFKQFDIDSAAGKEYRKSMDEVAGAIERGASAFLDAASSGADFGDVMLSLARDIEKMVLQLLVLKPLMRALFGEAGGGPSGSGGGLLGDFFGSMFGSFFGGGSPAPSGGGGGFSTGGGGSFLPSGGFFGFASGGSFDVGGAGGIDSQMVAFRASPGEHVQVGEGDRGAGKVEVNHYVITPPGFTARQTEQPNATGGKDVFTSFEEQSAARMRKGSPLGQGMEKNYGLKPRLVNR